MNKLYSVHDHWTDIAKKNDVDIESIDGVITGIKVNGEDYGGSGESDFSTAEVTFLGNIDDISATMPVIHSTPPININPLPIFVESDTYLIALYKGAAVIQIKAVGTITTSGDIELVDEGEMIYLVTGDCTITITWKPTPQ